MPKEIEDSLAPWQKPDLGEGLILRNEALANTRASDS